MVVPEYAQPRRRAPCRAPLTGAAIYLVITINPGADNCARDRSFCAELAALEFRDLDVGLTCIIGIGS
jgi:putative iron-dependent peroxidase